MPKFLSLNELESSSSSFADESCTYVVCDKPKPRILPDEEPSIGESARGFQASKRASA